jgi:uncharacterized damage-inducible protein DinB
MSKSIDDQRYPIGQIESRPFSRQQKEDWIADIRYLPQLIERAVQNLDETQLHTPYREGGWTVHQLVHHVVDSHMNAFIRFKLGLTEDAPTIKPYDENLWVRTDDVSKLPINLSITLLFALHERWVALLQSLSDQQWKRVVFHPEQKKELSLWELLAMYAWHGRHHTAHITALRERMGW